MKKKPGGHDDLQGMVGGRPAEDGAGGVEGLMEGLHNLVAMLVKDHDRINHKWKESDMVEAFEIRAAVIQRWRVNYISLEQRRLFSKMRGTVRA